jgi:hypothetical protein
MPRRPYVCAQPPADSKTRRNDRGAKGRSLPAMVGPSSGGIGRNRNVGTIAFGDRLRYHFLRQRRPDCPPTNGRPWHGPARRFVAVCPRRLARATNRREIGNL